jgi:hypothetical protein
MSHNEEKITEAMHIEAAGLDPVKVDDSHDTFKEDAMFAEMAEQSMTFKEAIRDYPSAVFWSFAISLCIIMEGYDTALPVSLSERTALIG